MRDSEEWEQTLLTYTLKDLIIPVGGFKRFIIIMYII